MGFIDAITNELNNETKLTENGAVAYRTSGKKLLDLNFEQEDEQMALMLSIPVIRAKDESEIEEILRLEDEKANKAEEEEEVAEDEESEDDAEEVEETEEEAAEEESESEESEEESEQEEEVSEEEEKEE